MKDGRKANWREDLALKLINLQKADGSWANDNGRWWKRILYSTAPTLLWRWRSLKISCEPSKPVRSLTDCADNGKVWKWNKFRARQGSLYACSFT